MALGYPCIYLVKERRSEKEKDKCHPCYNVILCYVQIFTGKQNYFLQEIHAQSECKYPSFTMAIKWVENSKYVKNSIECNVQVQM